MNSPDKNPTTNGGEDFGAPGTPTVSDADQQAKKSKQAYVLLAVIVAVIVIVAFFVKH